MTGPIEHSIRPPLPWRDDRITECGRPVADVASALTREEMVAKVRRQGQQRAAMTSCMTCWSTANRHLDWDRHPSSVIERYLSSRWRTQDEDEPLIDRELRAIALLIEGHRAEFDELVEGLGAVGDLRRARLRKVREARYSPRPGGKQ